MKNENRNEYANTIKNDRKVTMEGLRGVAKAVYIHGICNALTEGKTEFALHKFEVALKTKSGKVIPLGRLMHESGIKTATPAMTLARARVWEQYLLGKTDYAAFKAAMAAEAKAEKEAREIARQLKAAASEKDAAK